MSPLDAVFVAGGLVAGPYLLAGLRGLPRARSVPQARVSIVVPARDEERTLPTLLASVRALDPAPHEVLVVDDHSTDATGVVAEASGARVLHAPPLPEGWLGKPWACHVGAGAASGTHLLFLDADVRLAPDALARLVADADDGLLSVQPFHRTEGAGEQLSAFPNLVALMGSGVFAPWPRAGRAAAFGPCLLTTRAAYERAGGHGAVRAEVVEDLQLARRYAAAGLPVTGRVGGEVVGYRMYPGGLRELGQGWTKNLAAGAMAASPWAVGLTVWWVAAVAAIGAGLPLAAWHWLAGGSDRPVLAAVAWAVAAFEIGWLLGRVGRFQRWTAVLFVVPLVAFVGLFAASLGRTVLRRPATWKGRRVRMGAS